MRNFDVRVSIHKIKVFYARTGSRLSMRALNSWLFPPSEVASCEVEHQPASVQRVSQWFRNSRSALRKRYQYFALSLFVQLDIFEIG